MGAILKGQADATDRLPRNVGKRLPTNHKSENVIYNTAEARSFFTKDILSDSSMVLRMLEQ
jgi:hypothetical protein